MMTRAIVFDLDDTLYPERRFALSSFAAVSEHVSRAYGLPVRDVFQALVRSLRTGRRRFAFQDLCSAYSLPLDIIPELVDVVRSHRPRLRMPGSARTLLAEMRKSWSVGVLTNGLPAVQARKTAALQLADTVDEIGYAEQFADGGKPATAAFLTILAHLGARPSQAVFVGNDPRQDIGGARKAGMKTIRIEHRNGQCQRIEEADAVVTDLLEIPAIASRLITEASVHGA